jgi:oligopeptide transport system permease protein
MSTITKHQNQSSLWKDASRRFTKNKLALLSLLLLFIIISACLFLPNFLPYTYDSQDLVLGASAPSLTHLLGTDILGRDLLTRTLYGGRISFAVGLCATFVSVLIGIIWGSIAGWTGGKTDSIMMRFVDIVYAFPFIIFVILLMVFFNRSLFLLFAAIGAVEWLTMARIVRGLVMTIKKQEYICAAIGMGFTWPYIIFKHVIPNIYGSVIVYTTLTIPSVMLLEAFLSFLGLGVQPPASSWGILIKEGAQSMEAYPWLLIFPGLFLSVTLFSLNFVGDGLRNALDPKMVKD